ncbi:MAG: NAD+ synthase (glutamine-hydrolyzing) [Sphingobacteriales bacterium]|jgi:NAD+ synthase (glutamine-hydrolysing)
MQIALAQLNYHTGNFTSNSGQIIKAIHQAKAKGAELVVFAELAICGYPPRDFLNYHDFVVECEEHLKQIAKECVGIACIIGGPEQNKNLKGKKLFNSAFFMEDGVIKQSIQKQLLPTYDVFDEYRYFEPSKTTSCIEFKGRKIALTICEDLWNIGEKGLYPSSPMEELIKQQPDLIINIAASPFNKKQRQTRLNILKENVAKYNLPLVYVNHVGAQTELLFDGGSVAINNKGQEIIQPTYFKSDLLFCELAGQTVEIIQEKEIAQIHQALVMGISDYFTKSGFKKAILGLSGGIDSALTYVLAQQALGVENVMGVIMPSGFSSQHSVDDANDLVKNTGGLSRQVNIKEIYALFGDTLKPHFANNSFGLMEENLQARIRGVLLMAMSNKEGYIVLNTSNKSENAVGYSTIYGDMCGGLGALGDVYKTQVFAMANYLNRDQEFIPHNTLNKPPSAELRPDQKDSDSLPDYDTLDEILHLYIEGWKSSNEIISMGFEEQTVQKILNLVNSSEYKRFQTPPILRVSTKAFGMGRRMPIVAKYDLN